MRNFFHHRGRLKLLREKTRALLEERKEEEKNCAEESFWTFHFRPDLVPLSGGSIDLPRRYLQLQLACAHIDENRRLKSEFFFSSLVSRKQL